MVAAESQNGQKGGEDTLDWVLLQNLQSVPALALTWSVPLTNSKKEGKRWSKKGGELTIGGPKERRE